MKKKSINNVLNALIEVMIGFSILFFIAGIFQKCTEKKLDPQTVEMLSTHSDKGLVTVEDGFINIRR